MVTHDRQHIHRDGFRFVAGAVASNRCDRRRSAPGILIETLAMPSLQTWAFILEFEATVIPGTQTSISATWRALRTKLITLYQAESVDVNLHTSVFEELLTFMRLSRQTEQPLLRGTPTMMRHPRNVN
jgi:hypothetical protein